MCEMEGWKEFRTSDFGNIVTGSTPDTKTDVLWNGDYPFYSPADFSDDLYCNKTERTVSTLGVMTGRIIPKNSIMIACIASIGKMALNSEDGITNQQINTIVVNDNFDFKYIYYLLLFNVNKIKSIAPQTTIPIINKTTFSNLLFYSASDIYEQRKIAEILSTIDTAIEQTEVLIAKYKNIKKGLMHELLSYGIDKNGNIRNPKTHSFVEKNGMIVPKEWEVEVLGSCFDTFRSGNNITAENIFQMDKYPVYGGNGLRGYTDSFTHNGKYVLIGRQGALCGNINMIEGKNFVSEHAIAVQANLKNDDDYWFYKLESMKLNQYSAQSAQPGLAVQKLVLLLVGIPLKNEQEKISKVLLQHDKLIQSEQTNLAKLQKQKQGLMQDLLTGKVRVKTEVIKD